ncbi:MAG TPA: RNA 2',3'-cyclic phosphodiesterase [Devosiaceae bacterium]|nr:RNA 2',3'-cyclic phosphodiesterase [Devosiaceae bacterium]
MPRLFTGLDVPPDAAFALSLKRGGVPGARWIDPENYHITLRYIGDVDRRTAGEVREALDRFSSGGAFTLTVSRLAAFGGHKPRSIYAGLDPSPALGQLHLSQDRLLQRLGLEPDGRKFIPHVTLARLRDADPVDVARYLGENGHFQPLAFPVSRFVLFSSRESVGGGPYVVEQAYPLAA